VLFNSSGTRDEDGSIAAYEWTFGDNGTSTAPAPTHAYTTAGTYTVTLKVTDDKGATATATAQATISAAPTGSNGTLSVALTDAPFPFDSVDATNVFVVRIEGRTAAVADAELQQGIAGDNANTNPATGFVAIASPNKAINLLDLQGGKTLTIGSRVVPAGSYSGFRLIVDVSQSSITLASGAAATVNWGTTGRYAIRVNTGEAVVVPAGGTKNMIVDFDVGRSFPLVGTRASGGFGFTPYANYITPAYTGVAQGTAMASGLGALKGATIELLTAGTTEANYSASRVVQVTSTDQKGVYRFGYVIPGTYVLRATPPASINDGPQYSGDFQVTAGQATPNRTIEFGPLK
jgi:PKD repeat protein